MTFTQRLSYFGGGLFIGIVLLFFFLSGKKTSCEYSPNSRVLKNIRLKERSFTAESLFALKEAMLDTSAISEILKTGQVNFSKSNTKLDSCKTYFITGIIKTKSLNILIENCNKKAIINKISSTEIIE